MNKISLFSILIVVSKINFLKTTIFDLQQSLFNQQLPKIPVNLYSDMRILYFDIPNFGFLTSIDS